ncbi:MAG: ABC transporter ATP-binding protein [Thermoplasmata archaeon]
MERPTIDIRDLRVTYGQVVALDSFSVSLPSGITGLLGPNGAGKSTLIKVLIGLKKPEKGKVKVRGMVPWKHTLYLRDNIGYMPEHDCLIDGMNAVSLVSHFGKISGMEKDDTVWRAHEVLDFVGVNEERYRNIGTYSTGMKQRIKLAQALVHDPPILLLDEPTEGMDPEGKEDMLELISMIGDTGKTVIISSHLLHEIERTADYIVIIHQGRHLRTGPLKDILKGDEKAMKCRVTGEPGELSLFKKYVEKSYEVYRSKISGNELNIIMEWDKGSKEFFRLVLEHDLRVREYLPYIRSLEDVFFLAFKEGT